jgi:hypothetical protein
MDHHARREPLGLTSFPRCVFLLALVCGCEQESVEPNWLFRGDWINVDGRDRTIDETCAGTFDYLDSYAGALAIEFGIGEHLGTYRWYSPEQYDEDRPCGEAHPYACAFPDKGGIDTPLLPHEHELVHLADFAAAGCPAALAEGLAEYYSTLGANAQSGDLDLLVARLGEPSEHPPDAEYGILGRFAAFLVHRFGLDAIIEVCRITGRYPNGDEFASAMMSVFDVSTDTLLSDFAADLGPCNSAKIYQSRVFACGVGEAAPDAGLVTADFEATYVFDCASEITIGPIGDEIWIVERIDFDADGTYVLALHDEDGEIPEVELLVAKCEACGSVHSFPAGVYIGPEQFTAGRYSLELRAAAGFSGRLTLTITRVD